MADKTKALYQSGIPGSDSEIPTKNKAEAEAKRARFEAGLRYEKSVKKRIPRNDGAFRLETVSEALKKTSK